jgi:transposase InsO family protein
LEQTFHAFATTPPRPPAPAPGVEHAIHLTDPAPIKQASYRLPPSKKAAVEKNVEKLLKQNLIAPSNSPWSSPVVLVPKHDGEWRMCIDYRRVNARTRKDAYPIPLIEDCLNMCKNAKWLTLIDIKDAYHHILMAPGSRQITAFVTPQGLFEWKRMPFGLCNAPATFQRYVDHQLREYIGKCCAAFFDDCLVYSSGTLEDHALKVKAILEKLAAAGLEANTAKCKFAYTELLFVGHIVSQGTIRPDPSKLAAVTDWPVPTNATGVKSFLGFTNYYHKFIKGFALMARPLYALTRKGQPFEWTQAAQAAFVQLKEALLSAPCLYAPDFKLPFTLHTDASGDGISGVLSQVVTGEEHPVAFISRQLNKAERNYSASEWECLAVVWAVGQFEPYLLDAPFTIVTDHSALQWLQSKRYENSRLMRWAMKLQEFSFTVRYRPGKQNANADGPSRYPVPNSAPPESESEPDTGVPGITPGSRAPHFIRQLHVRFEVDQALPGRTAVRTSKKRPRSSAAPASASSSAAPASASSSAAPASASSSAAPAAASRAEAPDPFYDFTLVNDLALERLVRAQRLTQQWGVLIKYLERKELPASFESNQRRRLVNDAQDFALLPVGNQEEPALYYLPARPRRGAFSLTPVLPRLVIPQGEFRSELLQLFHNSPFGGHFGIKRTYRKIAARYYWPSLLADVEHHVKACMICQREKARRQEVQIPGGLIDPPTRPFELFSMDFIGPLTKSEDFKYVLVIIDHYSHWAIGVPMQAITVANTARALVEEVFCKFGVPSRILSDNGAQFRNELMKQLHSQLRIKQLFTTTYHPQSNGMVERLNGTLKTLLYAIRDKYHGQWIHALQPALFAYNTSVSEFTLMTPFFILYGCEAVTPGDALAISAEARDGESANLEGYVSLLHGHIRNAHAFMDSIISNKKLRVHEKNMTLARIPTYKMGDLVYVQHELARSRSRVGHVQPFTGPWRVTARLGTTTYSVEPVDPSCEPRLSSINVHTGRLKPYVRNQPEPASAAGAEQVAWQAVPAAAASAPALLAPSEHSRPLLGSLSAEEHHELSSDRQLRRQAERAADESKEDFDFTASPHASSPPVPMDVEEQSSVPPSQGPQVAPSSIGSAAQAARGRHHSQDQPNYSENALVPTEPRPQERYSLPSRIREPPPMAYHSRGPPRK